MDMNMKTLDKFGITAFDLMELIAQKHYDGHYTIMKFTTNYRFCFGTISYVSNYTEAIRYMAEGKTLEEAIINGIKNGIDSYKIDEQLSQIPELF